MFQEKCECGIWMNAVFYRKVCGIVSFQNCVIPHEDSSLKVIHHSCSLGDECVNENM